MAKKDSVGKTTVRIGISETSQELHFEVALASQTVIEIAKEAIAGNLTLELTDIKDRVILVPAGKISYLEIGDTSDQKVGFTAL
jgi:hypothetical protein